MSEHFAGDVVQILTHGDLDVVGRLVDASNATIKCVAELDGATFYCVYKPRRGERPLWDFPQGSLGEREVAAYVVSEAAGWSVVPPTVWRESGPIGAGMCQLWFDADDECAVVDLIPAVESREGWRVVLEAQDSQGDVVRLIHADVPALRTLAAFDAVANNADRKGGHVLARQGEAGLAVAGIDHGLTFHDEDKLRTVLWGFAGEAIDASIREGLDRLARAIDAEDAIGAALYELLAVREVRALRDRLEVLRTGGCYPLPSGDWPPLPWPVF